MPACKSNRRLTDPSVSKIRILAAVAVSGIFISAISPSFAASGSVNFSGNINTSASQVLSPLSAQTVSFTDSAALRLRSANVSSQTVRLDLKAYDENSNPVNMKIWSGRNMLAPGQATMTTVVLPLGGLQSARFTICAVQTAHSGTQIGRACGRYTVDRKSLGE